MASTSPEVQAAWRAGNPVAGVNFAHDDLVTILAGEHTGNVGSLVSIEQLEPEVVYLVEIDSGFNVPAKQSEIERVD
jgi:ribosomal protein S4E